VDSLPYFPSYIELEFISRSSFRSLAFK
jgi:hypothetical protein